MFAIEENVDLLQYTPKKSDKLLQFNPEQLNNESKELSLDTLKRNYLAEITNLNKSWSLNLERLKNDLEKKYSTKILQLKDQLAPLLLKTKAETVEKSIMTYNGKEIVLLENANKNKMYFLKDSSCQCDFIDFGENQIDFNFHLEDILTDQMASLLTEGIIQKVSMFTCKFYKITSYKNCNYLFFIYLKHYLADRLIMTLLTSHYKH